MTLRSPTSAMLWELWRVTRAEVAWKLVLPIGGALTALALGAAFAPTDPTDYQQVNDNVAALALILIVLPHLAGWLSIGKLSGGRPGYPLYLSYTRPVGTAVLVGLPLAYLTALSAAIYLVSAIVLRLASSYAFPLLPVAAWMAALTLVFMAGAWSSRIRVVPVLVWVVAVTRALGLSMARLTAVEIPDEYDWPPRLWPTLFDWPRTDYAWVALIAVACFGVTLFMVTRQRRGDRLFGLPWFLRGLSRAESRGLPRVELGDLWNPLAFASLFRFPCPTSSPTRAQLWFDLKSNGLPVLTIGVALALVIVPVSVISGPLDAAWNADPDVVCPIKECFWARAIPPMWAPFSLFVVLSLAGNAFGIRWRQGRAFISAFDATQAYGTLPLAILKLLVKSVCVIAALSAIVVSFWISIPILGDPVFIQMIGVPLSSRQSSINIALAALSGYQQLALVVVAVVGVVVWVASWAALGALRMRYRLRVNIATCLLLVYGAVFFWLAIGVRADPETASRLHLDVVYDVMCWINTAVIVFTTVYVFWTGFVEDALTVRYASGAAAIAAAFGMAWLTALHITGAQLAEMSVMNAIRVVSPALLPLMAGGLAPWSYSRIRSL